MLCEELCFSKHLKIGRTQKDRGGSSRSACFWNLQVSKYTKRTVFHDSRERTFGTPFVSSKTVRLLCVIRALNHTLKYRSKCGSNPENCRSSLCDSRFESHFEVSVKEWFRISLCSNTLLFRWMSITSKGDRVAPRGLCSQRCRSFLPSCRYPSGCKLKRCSSFISLD